MPLKSPASNRFMAVSRDFKVRAFIRWEIIRPKLTLRPINYKKQELLFNHY